jgi:HEAT repeat protein
VGLFAPVARAEDEPGTYAGRDARWWIEQFRDPEGAVAAKVALKKIGRPAIGPLVDALSSPEPSVRHGAAQALAALGADATPALEAVVSRLAGAEPQLQFALLEIVRGTGRAALPHVEAISVLLDSTADDLAQRAAGVLGGLGPAGRPTMVALLDRASRTSTRRAQTFVWAAGQVAPGEPEVVAALGDLWARTDDTLRANLVGIAEKLDPRSPGLAALLVRMSGDGPSGVRQHAARVLGRLAPDSPEAHDALVGLLAADDRAVRAAAAWTLAGLGSRAAAAVPALLRVLEDSDATAHPAAIHALAKVGPPGRPALPLVLRIGTAGNLSNELSQAVGAFLAATPEATMAALVHEHPRLREAAFEVLAQWSRERWAGALPDVIGPVGHVLREREQPGSHDARVLETLGSLAANHDDVLRTLLGLHAARSAAFRAIAARKVAEVPKAGELLVELLSSEVPEERTFAEAGLEWRLQRGDSELQAHLVALFHHPDPEIRMRAGGLVVRRPGYLDPARWKEEDAKALVAIAASLLRDPASSSGALTCLGAFGVLAEAHLDAIAALLDAPVNSTDASQAAWTLVRIAQAHPPARGRVDALLVARLTGPDPAVAARASPGLTPEGKHDALLMEILPALMRHAGPDVHFPAVDTARHMGPRAKALLPVLEELVVTPKPGSHVHQWAINAMGAIAPEDPCTVRAALVAVADPKRRDSRTGSLQVLTQGGDTAVGLVAAALGDADTETRLALLGLLAGFGPRALSARASVEPLTRAADERVAKAAKTTLEAIGR